MTPPPIAILKALLDAWENQYQWLMALHREGACPTLAGILAKLEQTILTTRQYLARVEHDVTSSVKDRV